MLEETTTDMQRTATKLQPLVARFVAEITADVQRLEGEAAPLTTPMNDPAAQEAVRNIRKKIDAFEHEINAIHQTLVTDVQKIALTWILPGDAQVELNKIHHSPPALPLQRQGNVPH